MQAEGEPLSLGFLRPQGLVMVRVEVFEATKGLRAVELTRYQGDHEFYELYHKLVEEGTKAIEGKTKD